MKGKTPSRLMRVLRTYTENLAAFHPNARLYLLYAILTGASMGVFRLLFNFFVLSRNYDATLLGSLVTTNSLTALLLALPMGFVADRLGRKVSLIIGALVSSSSILLIALFPSIPLLFMLNILLGAGQSLSGVTMGPFLMENSGEKERVYLFSFNLGLQAASTFLGNWIGGYLPTWLGNWLHASATSSQSYGASILVIAIMALVGSLPLYFLRKPKTLQHLKAQYNPLLLFRKQPALTIKLILPTLITFIGAGLIMPFMNVFFRQVHHQPDPVIGAMFAWGSLAMGVGFLIAPALADRFGKIQLVVITQALSVPFLVLLGFSPAFYISASAYYIRLALMNMSSPVYQTFVMEHVEPDHRATMASLVNMATNFGGIISPTISGWLQDHYGFPPAFVGTIVLYCISIFFFWRFFWYKPRRKIPAKVV